MRKLWDGLAMFNLGLGLLSFGVGWFLGPSMILAAYMAGIETGAWGISFVFFSIGLLITVNLIWVLWHEWRRPS